MSNYFDIRTRIPNYGHHTYGRPEPEALYDEINLMCYLLRGMRYGILYKTRLVEVLGYLRQRVAIIPAGLANATERDAALQVLDRFIQQLNAEPTSPINYKTFTLRMLYMTYPKGKDARVDTLIRGNFAALNRAARGRLCLPFLEKTTKSTLKEINDHTSDLGSCDLQDLYELPKRHYSDIARAIVRDRDNGILVRKTAKKPPKSSKEKLDIKGGGGGGGGTNYRKCVNSVCVDVAEVSYCSLGADGTCSVSSG